MWWVGRISDAHSDAPPFPGQPPTYVREVGQHSCQATHTLDLPHRRNKPAKSRTLQRCCSAWLIGWANELGR